MESVFIVHATTLKVQEMFNMFPRLQPSACYGELPHSYFLDLLI